jgi:glycosyltransferase involved in cell wall biosynthesis
MPDGNRDGIPNTVLEAMARALPVVSTTLPSVQEAVDDGVQGLLVPQRDPAALADALQRLLGDAELRRQLGAAGRVRVEEKFDRLRCGPRIPELLTRAGLLQPG